MIEKVKSIFANLPMRKLIIGAVLTAVSIVGVVMFQSTCNKYYLKLKDRVSPPIPVMPVLPKVDYSLDRNWSTCIYRRLEAQPQGKELIKTCDDAFSAKK